MDFSTMTATPNPTGTAPINTTGLDLDKQLPATVDDAAAYQERLKQLPEVKNMTEELNPGDMSTVLNFGAKPSIEVSKVSDQLLANMQGVDISEATEMINQLTVIMNKFDIGDMKDIERMEQEALAARQELAQEGSSWRKKKLQRMVDNIMKKLKDLMNDTFRKYDNMGTEVDKILVLLQKYSAQLQRSTDELTKLGNANSKFYEDLEKYIAAGDLGVQEIIDQKALVTSNPNMSPEMKANITEQLNMFQELLEQRVMDLRTAEAVALQTNPMLRSMLLSNFNLQRTITSSLITTLPVFKQCLISSINLKRQAIISLSMSALADETNKLMIKNAQMNATQSAKIMQQASSPQIKVETLQQTYDIIKKGIEETKQIQEQSQRQRVADTNTLEAMKHEIKGQGWA